MTDDDEKAVLDQAKTAAQLARVALIVSTIAVALSILGLFLPIQIGG